MSERDYDKLPAQHPLVARVTELEDALRTSAERLHDLSDDPAHMRSVFADCEHYACVEARAALQPPKTF